MTHNDFIYLRSKGGRGVFMFYGNYEDYLNEYSEEERKDYEETPVPFEDLNLEDLSELLGNLLEDRNNHSIIYMIDILTAILREDVDEKTAAKIMRHYILCLEANWTHEK